MVASTAHVYNLLPLQIVIFLRFRYVLVGHLPALPVLIRPEGEHLPLVSKQQRVLKPSADHPDPLAYSVDFSRD